ncbi:hypothetical protein IAR50_003819 [Cryptococcus sp. DSM 104548]
MSLNSVVSRLVRAASGISADISDADLDAHVAQLLAQEAKAKETKWSELGLSGLLGNSMLAGRDEPDPSLPKPNKRFLASIIRTVDGHNSALLRSQAGSARQARQERMPDLPPSRGQPSSKRGGAGPAGRLFGGAMRDMSRNEPKRDDRGARRVREEGDHEIVEKVGRNDRRERSDRSKGKERERDERSHRSDHHHREDRTRDSERQDEEEDRHQSRRDKDRRGRERGLDRRDRKQERDRERDRDRRRYRHDSFDEDRPRKSRRSYSPDERSYRRSRHNDSDVEHLPPKSPKSSRHQSSSSKPPPPRNTPPPKPRSPSRSPSPSPPPPPKSKMDRYFEESYDPRLDFPTTVASEGIVQDVGWDNMLAVLKERGKKKRRQSPSLSDDESAPPPGILPRKRARSPDTALAKLERRERKAERKKRKDRRRDDSESEDEMERAWRKEKKAREKEEKGDDEGGLGGYEYTKKGGTRAWDVGK